MKKKLLLVALVALCLSMVLGMVFTTSATDPEPATAIKGKNLSLDDSVHVIFYVDEVVPAGAEAGVLCWYEAQDEYTLANKQYELKSAGKSTVSGKEYTVYDFPYVAAKMFADDIYAVSYVKVGDEVTYSKLNKYSVLQYCINKKDSTTTMGGFRTLGELVYMIREYGAMAQEFFGYRTDRLANDEFFQVKVKNATLADGTTNGLFLGSDNIDMYVSAEDLTTDVLLWTYDYGDGVEALDWRVKEDEEWNEDDLMLSMNVWADTTFAAHSLVFVEAVDPSVGSDGVDEHWECALHSGEYFIGDPDDYFEPSSLDDLLIPADHHYGEWIPEVPATCTTEGVKGHYACGDANCQEPYADENYEVIDDLTIEMLPHTLGELIAETPASCTEAGEVAHYHCSACGNDIAEDQTTILDTVVIPATGHSAEVWVIDEEATCTEAGSRHKVCTVCGEDFANEVVLALGHNFGDLIPAVAYTLTEDGTKAYYHCDRCDKDFDEEGNELVDPEDYVIPAGIYTAEDMLALATAVNGGTTFAGETINLWADVDMTGTGFNGIGNGGSYPFMGNFNGQGHTINITQSKTDTDGNAGFICMLRVPENGTVTIQNVHVTGTIDSTANSDNYYGYISGLVGMVDAGTSGNGGTANIINCWSSVRINMGKNRHWAVGGLVGFTRHSDNLKPLTLNIDSCLWDGILNDGAAVSFGGGLVGYTGNNKAGRTLTINITNTVAAGTIWTNQTWDEVGYLIGYAKGSFNDADTAKVTINMENVIATGKVTYAQSNTKEVCGFVGKVDGTTDLNMTNVYYKPFTIKRETSVTSPLIGVGEANVEDNVNAYSLVEIVEMTGDDFGDETAWSFADASVPCPAAIVDTFGEYPATLQYNVYELYYDTADTFEIATVEDMLAFRDAVNSGKTFEGKNIVLTADLDMTGTGFAGIGSVPSSRPFSGNFDGQGHTINITQSLTDPDGNGGFIGFVRVPTNGTVTIKNLHTTGVITLKINTAGKGYISGLIDAVDAGKNGDGGILNIENCQVSVRINKSNQNAYALGGFIAFVRHEDGLKPLTINIDSCVWDGIINVGGYTDYSGGLIAYTGNNKAGRTLDINVTNTVIAGQFWLNSYADDTGVVFGYLKGTNSSDETAKITATLTDVVVTGKLSSTYDNGATKWLGIIGGANGTTEVTLTNFYYIPFNIKGVGEAKLIAGGTTVPTEENVNAYTLSEIAVMTGDDFDDPNAWIFAYGYLPCPASIVDTFGYPEAVKVNPFEVYYDSNDQFEIATAEDMINFRKAVNNGKSFEGKTVLLTNDIDLEGIEWVEIGKPSSTSNPGKAFKGTFDGQDHTIANMTTALAPTSGWVDMQGGLFGSLGDGAVVKNFTLTGSMNIDNYSTSTGSTDYFGSVANAVSGTVLIQNVKSEVNITTTNNKNANGTWPGGVKNVAGLVGFMIHKADTNLTIEGCEYAGTINTPNEAINFAGIIAYTGNRNGSTKVLTIKDTTFSGMMTLNHSYAYAMQGVAGFLGYAVGDQQNQGTGSLTINIENCHSAGQIKFNEEKAFPTVDSDGNPIGFGQIIGRADEGTDIKVTETTYVAAYLYTEVTEATEETPATPVEESKFFLPELGRWGSEYVIDLEGAVEVPAPEVPAEPQEPQEP